MFGSCVLSRAFAALVITLLFPFLCWAQSQQATVVLDGALIYQDPDFDSPVINTVKRGAVYSISKNKKGAFYKIRLKPGSLGWISDTDIQLGVVKLEKPKEAKKDKKDTRKKPFHATRYRGPVIDFINYTEDTLRTERSQMIPFFGFKFSGENTLFDGEIYTDASILFHFGAPGYYEEYTGKGADGYIFMANFLLQTVLPQSKTHLFYYGFGPMFRYSHFNIDVPDGGDTITYSADDMTLGAVFDLGLAFRFGAFSLKTDARYYWERTKYYGYGLSLGYEF
ncbi:SH3 domain-containing protein [Bdellovibrio bacteriovorus]